MNCDPPIDPASPYPRGDKATWAEQATRIFRGEVPGVELEIPALLCWLEDYNWPGAHEIADFLLNLGRPVVPHVKYVLRHTDDLAWKYWLLVALVLRWPQDYVNEVGEEVLLLAKGEDDNEVHLVALEVCIKANLIGPIEAIRLIGEKEGRHPDLKRDTENLRRALRT